MSGPVTLTRFARDSFAALSRAWSQVWFQDSPTSPLELARIGIGAAILLHYTLAFPHIFDLWGDAGWMPRDVVLKIRDPWMQSVFYYFGAPWEWVAFHGLFLLCCAAFMVGWRTSLVKWIVLVGQISYVYRNPLLAYGVDWIVASLLFILCAAPVGRALSLDRVRAVRAAKVGNIEARLPPYASVWAGACTRLMQIQMAVLFFYSAISKLTVGAVFGLTCSRYQSGEIDWSGKISRCGDEMMRTMLYEAAQSMMHSKKWSWLKAWAMQIARRRGMKKAIVALARRLAVIMHRIWVDGTEFRWTREQAAAAA